jgi:hypothetical protein
MQDYIKQVCKRPKARKTEMAVEDILFAPIGASWRSECQQMYDYVYNHKYQPSYDIRGTRIRPTAALDLFGLCELYHDQGQDLFYVFLNDMMFRRREIKEIFFDGRLTFDLYSDWGFPHLTLHPQWSVRDLNLVPSGYSDNYLFDNMSDAESYWKGLSP